MNTALPAPVIRARVAIGLAMCAEARRLAAQIWAMPPGPIYYHLRWYIAHGDCPGSRWCRHAGFVTHLVWLRDHGLVTMAQDRLGICSSVRWTPLGRCVASMFDGCGDQRCCPGSRP